MRVVMPQAASSAVIVRQAKRETTTVSYSDLEAWHSGDGVILLVGLQSFDVHLSVHAKTQTKHLSVNLIFLQN